jgi:hypothetical protein
MAKSNLHRLSELGQSVWVDSVSREWLETGELERLMREDAVVGVTSNPTIFQKAISSGNAYDDQLRELAPALDRGKRSLDGASSSNAGVCRQWSSTAVKVCSSPGCPPAYWYGPVPMGLALNSSSPISSNAALEMMFW